MYDYLIVGAGMYGATFAEHAKRAGKSVLVIDKRSHVAGNCWTEKVNEIDVHQYGPHIFHTSDPNIWAYVNYFAKFNRYRHTVKAIASGRVWSFPINLLTLSQLWGVRSPDEAKRKLDSVKDMSGDMSTLEGWACAQVGREIYELFIKGYTRKQWGRDPSQLPSSIIRRLPIRLTYDDSYFNDTCQGIPTDGYTQLVSNMLSGCDVELGIDYLADRDKLNKLAHHVVYTGPIDAYFNHVLGHLEYRSLRFETETKMTQDYQGGAIVNHNDEDVPWTRITEHKHFAQGTSQTPVTVVTKEFPAEWAPGAEPYYPIGDARNSSLYGMYAEYAKSEKDVTFGGRLGTYKYYDMHQVIAQAMKDAKRHGLA